MCFRKLSMALIIIIKAKNNLDPSALSTPQLALLLEPIVIAFNSGASAVLTAPIELSNRWPAMPC